MQVHRISAHNAAQHRNLLEASFRLRHSIFVDRQGWEGIRRPDGRDVDAFDTDKATHLLVTEGDELVGGSRFNRHDGPTLLRTVFPGLVTEPFPAPPEQGVDWTRFYVRSDRREGKRRSPVSAALFCAVMEHALSQGFRFITFVSSIYMVEHGVAVGWRITPLGPPSLIDGKPTLAASIDVSAEALANVRLATGLDGPRLGTDDRLPMQLSA